MKGLRDRSARRSFGLAREDSIGGVRTKEGGNGRIKSKIRPCRSRVDRRSQSEGGEEWTNKMKDLGHREKGWRNGRTK